jgi:hypothetical protein
LFFYHIAKSPVIYPKGTLEVNLPPPDFWNWVKKQGFDIDVPPKGKWKQFEFGANDVDNVPVFTRLHKEIQNFISLRDTLHGTHIRLDRKMPYYRFIKILDMLQIENVARYSVVGSDIWVPRFPKRRYLPFHDVVFRPRPAPPTFSDLPRKL